MKLEEQVLSIEQAKHLQELGIGMSDAALCWCKIPFKDSKWAITDITGRMREDIGIKKYIIPTYTLQEIIAKLPKKINDDEDALYINYSDNSILYGQQFTDYGSRCIGFEHIEYLGNLLDAAYKMLCWVIENGYLK